MTDDRPGGPFLRSSPRTLAGLIGWCLAAASITLSAPAVGAQTDATRPTIIGVRLLYDQDSCPAFAEVYVEQLSDTVGAFELRLSWDRPDFARFETAAIAPGPVMAGDSATATRTVRQPPLERDSTSLGNWEYVEPRGESGLWVKVTAIACLTVKAPERLLYPGQRYTLFRLPLVAGRPAQDFLAGDSSIVRLDPSQSRLSRPDGQLLDSLEFHNDAARISPCRRLGSPTR